MAVARLQGLAVKFNRLCRAPEFEIADTYVVKSLCVTFTRAPRHAAIFSERRLVFIFRVTSIAAFNCRLCFRPVFRPNSLRRRGAAR